MKSPKQNSPFHCIHCGFFVHPHPTSSRNHCPECLTSLHVDEIPGDRKAQCGSIMNAIALTWNPNKGEQLVFQCCACHHISFCIPAPDDNNEKLISLRKAPLYQKPS